MKRSATIALFAVASVLAATAGLSFWTHRSSGGHDGRRASPSASSFFAQTLPDSDGTLVPMSDYRGRVVVVNFWAPWCDPCVEEIPAFSRLQSEFAPKGVRFVGIGIDSAEHIAKFRTRIPTTYPLLVAPEAGSVLARDFGNAAGALPFTVLVNREGVVVATKMGKVSENELRGWLASLIGAS